MSAHRDQSQKFTFVYSNLYQLYKKGKDAAINATIPKSDAQSDELSSKKQDDLKGVETSKIIKASQYQQNGSVVQVRDFTPPSFVAKRIENDKNLASPTIDRTNAIQQLKDNLKTLQGLQERLNFMLTEIEELSSSRK